jgi:amino acid transporter
MGAALRAWGFSVVALVVACAGLATLTASSSSTSLVRLGVAASVLSVFAATMALLMTRRSERTRLRCLVWGGAVPLAVGIATALLAGSAGGLAAGLLALLPWLAGVLAAVLLGPWLPTLRLPSLRRRHRIERFQS